MIQIITAFTATLAFSILFNIERTKALLASLGGALSWLVYLTVFKYTGSDFGSLFMGSFAMGLYSEILARILKSPATIFYIPGFIPLVPGATVYYAVYELVSGNNEVGLNLFVLSLVKAAAITLGVLFSGAFVTMIQNAKKRNIIKVFQPELYEELLMKDRKKGNR